MISNIRHAMATDATVVLIGCAPIHGNFYDLFNQRFSPDQRVVNGQLTVGAHTTGVCYLPCLPGGQTVLLRDFFGFLTLCMIESESPCC
jgi:hypothetical protein